MVKLCCVGSPATEMVAGVLLAAIGTVDLAYHMCVFDCTNDPTTCPKGSFCSKNGLDSGHFCMRECTTDDDCVMAMAIGQAVRAELTDGCGLG